MSQTKISRIETGRTLPTVLDVERILKALAVPDEVADELLRLARRANVDYASWRAWQSSPDGIGSSPKPSMAWWTQRQSSIT
jgi:transcriptional regulator with XRE-family HTH domain